MAASDLVGRFLAGTGMGARPPLEDDEELVRRFLAAQGRIADAPTTAEDTAAVQRGLAATQLRPQVAPESSPLAPRPVAQKTSPAAAGPTEEESAYNARRAAASRTAHINDTLAGVTEGFDRATNLISGINQPIRARNAQAVAEAEKRFLGQEEVREARALKERNRPLVEAEKAAALEKAKAETARAQASAASTTADAAYEAALRDVNSPETQAERRNAVALSEGKITPEMAAQMNGIQIRDALKTATSRLNADATAEYRNKVLEQQAQDTKTRAWLTQQGLDNQWDIAELLANVREAEGGKDRELKESLARLLAEAQANKRASGLAEREVGGFRFKPGAVPSADSAKKVRDSAIEEGKILYSLKKIEDLYAKHGTEVYGRYAGEMGAEFIAITNALRVINNMGVPNGRDYEMLEKEFADPTTWKDVFTSRARTQVKFDSLRQRIRNTMDTTADAAGYERAAPSQSAPPMGTMVNVDDMPTGRGSQAAPEPPPRPVTKSTAPPASEIPRIVSTKGMQNGDLLASLKDGETVRIAYKDKATGKIGYQTVQRAKKANGTPYVKLIGGVE